MVAATCDVIYEKLLPWLDTTWLRFIENTKKAHYMCQIFSQSDERCQK